MPAAAEAEQTLTTGERLREAAQQATGAPETAPDASGDAAATTGKKGAQTRPYRVLEVVKDDPEVGSRSYVEVGVYIAAGDKQAISKALDAKVIEVGGKFVAVAESAWHEHEPKLKEVAPRLAW